MWKLEEIILEEIILEEIKLDVKLITVIDNLF